GALAQRHLSEGAEQSSVVALLYHGLSDQRAGRDDKARQAFARALVLAEQGGEVTWLERAMVLHTLGRRDEALAEAVAHESGMAPGTAAAVFLRFGAPERAYAAMRRYADAGAPTADDRPWAMPARW